MKEKVKRTDAQSRADKAYETKRQGKPRLSGYISDDENKLLCELAKIYGSKKIAIMKGLELLKKQPDKVNK